VIYQPTILSHTTSASSTTIGPDQSILCCVHRWELQGACHQNLIAASSQGGRGFTVVFSYFCLCGRRSGSTSDTTILLFSTNFTSCLPMNATSSHGKFVLVAVSHLFVLVSSNIDKSSMHQGGVHPPVIYQYCCSTLPLNTTFTCKR
jgi:hypothetical protein